MGKKEKAKQDKQKWVLTVVCLSFALSIVMSFVTSIFLQSAGIFLAVLSLIVLVLIGIITDIIGMAVASANEQPFIAMASKRISGAKQALQLIRKAERVSSLLNDVVGDICGVISGSASAVSAAVAAERTASAAAETGKAGRRSQRPHVCTDDLYLLPHALKKPL